MHNGELHNLYFSPDIVRAVKSMEMRYVGLAAGIRERERERVRRNSFKF
jgi:hypothetical protein